MTDYKRGCDVSSFQDPGLVDWSKLDFGIVRATYGASPDRRAQEHAMAIRDAGKPLGFYHFFRATVNEREQVDAFLSAVRGIGYGAFDIVPFLDVEDYPGHALSVWDAPHLYEVWRLIRAEIGECGFYITQRDWNRLGCPVQVLSQPLWVAHYPRTGATSPLASPATPKGRPWSIWQCMVGPLGRSLQSPSDPKAVDQNVAECLPLLSPPHQEMPVPFALLSDEDWAEMGQARAHRSADD